MRTRAPCATECDDAATAMRARHASMAKPIQGASHVSIRLFSILLWLVLAGSALAQGAPNTPGAGLPTQTWPAGTWLADWPHGGRITHFHRGLLYLGGTGNQRTWIYDISNPRSPQLRCDWATEDNSHVWYKIGDLFYRQNLIAWTQTPPRLTSLAGFAGPSTCPATRQDWVTPIHDFPLASTLPGDDWMATYPYAFNYRVLDSRTGATVSMRNLWEEKGVTSTNRFRIGNLLFFTPGDGQTGVAVFDIGDPANPVLLDTLTGNYKQYTTTWQVWGHHLVMLHGDAENGPDADANALVIDFSDPSDLKIAWTIALEDMPGRYVHFQDDYAFSGHKTLGGVKYDMRNRQVVRRFPHPVSQWEWFTDFQWIPLGHLLLVSGSEPTGSRSYLFTHQDGRDTTPPSIAWHLPAANALEQPLGTVVGLVVNEQLDATTVNDGTIQLRPLGGEPLPAVVMHTSYDVVNVVPVDALQPDTTYEVRLVAGGLRDVAGNAVAQRSFYFSTGTSLALAPQIDSVSVSPAPTAAAPLRAGQSLAFSAVTRNATEYRWDFGDGQDSGWSATLAANHVYATPGVHVAQLQVRNALGQVASATRRLVVNPGAAAQAPAASGSMLVDAAGRRVWVLNPDHGSVAVFDADTRARLAVHALCADPRSLARDAAGQVWAACRGDDRLVALAADGSVADTIDTGYGSAPSAVVFDAAGTTGYATLAGRGELIRFDAGGGNETGRLVLGFGADALARSGTTLYAARLKSEGDAGTVCAIDLAGFTLDAQIALPLDTTSPDSGTAGRGLPNYVAALAVSPDNARVWYAAKKDNIRRGVARDGLELDFETTVRTMVGAIDTATAVEQASARRDLDNSALALSLAPSTGGGVLFVALAGNDRVVAIDPWRGGELARADTGAVPRGLAVDPVTQRLWVRNELGRSVSVYDAAALSVQGEENLPLLGQASTVAAETLSPAVLAGKTLFWRAGDARISADGYIACASCHLDGGSDARTWDFTQRGEGLRRTLPLQGRAGMGHGPVHWSANFDEIQDFEHDLREAFGGTGLMANAHFFDGTRDTPLGDAKTGVSAELDALAAYAASLDRVGRSPHRGGAALAGSALEGRALFATLGCNGCHGGAAFTDSAQKRFHDIGTGAAGEMRLGRPLQGFDTPTLRGVWKESRLLHDGRADDILDALVAHDASGRHGAVATLAAGDRGKLRDYLLAIDDNEPAAPAPFALQVTAPGAGTVDPGEPMRVTVASDLAGLVRIEVLLDGVAVGSDMAAPWQIDVPVAAGSRPQLQIRAVHASGAVTTTWPQSVDVGAQAGQLFRDGFE